MERSETKLEKQKKRKLEEEVRVRRRLMNLCVTEDAPTTEEDRKKIDAKKKRRGNYRRKGKKKSKEQKVRTALKTTPTLVWSGSSYGRVIREQLPIITLYYSSTAVERQRTFSRKKKTARSITLCSAGPYRTP